MKTNEVIGRLVRDLAMVNPNVPAEKVAAIVDDVLGEWTRTAEIKLVEMIREWEDRMPEDDTLYTLGLRRALDVIRGEDPNNLK